MLTTLGRSTLAVVLLAGPVLAEDPPKADPAQAAAEALAKFDEAVKQAADVEATRHAMHDLALVKHEKVLPALAKYLVHRDSVLREGAAVEIGTVGAALPEQRRPLAVRALAPALRQAERNPEFGVVVIKALAAIGDPSATAPLVGCFGHKQAAVVKAAIEAFQILRDKTAIEPIINELMKVRSGPRGGGGSAGWGGSMPPGSTGGGDPGSGGGTGNSAGGNGVPGGAGPGAEAMNRVQAVQEAGFATLAKLTGQSFTDAMIWKSWWKQHKATFKLAADPPPASAG